MNHPLIDELAAVLTAGNDDDVALAALRGWQATVPADYHSMMRRTEATAVVDFWNPQAGRLDSEHWLVKLFARLWAAEDPSGTHPAVIAFLQQGPGAYLRSQIEPDEIWHQRAHYQIVDAAHGIKDMVSAFLVTAPGTLVVLNAGSKSGYLDPAIVPPAGRYAAVLATLLTSRGGFTAERDNRIDRLTNRELQVLRLVRAGKRNAEITAGVDIAIRGDGDTPNALACRERRKRGGHAVVDLGDRMARVVRRIEVSGGVERDPVGRRVRTEREKAGNRPARRDPADRSWIIAVRHVQAV